MKLRLPIRIDICFKEVLYEKQLAVARCAIVDDVIKIGRNMAIREGFVK